MDSVRSKHFKTLTGRGEVYEGEIFLCDATYKLGVSQDIHTSQTFGPTTSTDEGLQEVRGIISECDIFTLQGKDHLTLHLKDGRRFDFFVVNDRGQISPTGRGLHTPESN